MQLQKRDDCALILMRELALAGERFISVNYVADQFHLSRGMVKQCVSSFKKSGLLESKEGIHGGYRLSRSPELITFSDILINSGLSHTNSCQARGHECHYSSGHCPVRAANERVAVVVSRSLSTIQLRDIVPELAS